MATRITYTMRENARLKEILEEKEALIANLRSDAANWQAKAERLMERHALIVKLLKEEE
jgi:hypothetical protein